MSNEEQQFDDALNDAWAKKAPDFSKQLTIAFVGKVSAGKSSLINAFLGRGRDNLVASVGAQSGVTTKVKFIRLDDHVCIADTPGLRDLEEANSEVTRQFLGSIDVGIFVVTGSADTSQKADCDALRKKCKGFFVVLNKIDEWDDLEPEAFDGVVEQWGQALGVARLYPTCTKGFDPKTRAGVNPDVRGVDELRSDVEEFIATVGKDLLLARHMTDKRRYALRIIIPALVAVVGEAFIPGSAVYITATQAAAIVSLYYVYTGRVLAKSQAMAALPLFAAESAGTTLFLWVKSFLPPTGVLDVAAAGVAVTVTAAMLVAVSMLFDSGHELRETELLRDKFTQLRGQVKGRLKKSSVSDWRSLAFWQELIHDLMYA